MTWNSLSVVCAGTVTDNIVQAFGLDEDDVEHAGEGVFLTVHHHSSDVDLVLVRSRLPTGPGPLQLFYRAGDEWGKRVALFCADLFALDKPLRAITPIDQELEQVVCAGEVVGTIVH